MNNHIIITILLALVSMTGQAKTFKTIKNPVAMACVNMSNGELKAREVIFRDTATTVHFTMEYAAREYFRFIKESYLMDEDGRRYPLRSAEGLALDTWVQSPESGKTDFTMHFAPMPKGVQVFDFIEGDVRGAFMLLGIHDGNVKLNVPTMQQLSEANPFTLPDYWFNTAAITIRGRIEGYDASRMGFKSLEGYVSDIFRSETGMMVIDIAPDGTFEKQFMASYPVRSRWYATETDVEFEVPFFARPGETIDITVRKNAQGRYECVYHNGSSREVERWLKSNLMTGYLSNTSAFYKGSFRDAEALAGEAWQNMLYRIDMVSRRDHFTPMEIQLALSEAQTSLAAAFMDFAMDKKYSVRKQVDGVYYDDIVDSVNWKALYDANSYTPLHGIDFNNPLMLSHDHFFHLVNRIQYASPVWQAFISASGQQRLDDYYAALRTLLGSKDNTLIAQLCEYQQMLTEFSSWRTEKERTIEALNRSPNLSDSLKQHILNNIPTVESRYAMVSATFTHPYVKAKADEFYRQATETKAIASPLPDAPMADLIHTLCAKYPGRYLMLDFWGMSCGPCRFAIERSQQKRVEIAKRDDVKLVFIAGERTTGGSDDYKKYVNEWLADEETVCVSNEDFVRLSELFRFAGIPHYETITPDGRVVRDDLRINGFNFFDIEFQQLKEKMKNR